MQIRQNFNGICIFFGGNLVTWSSRKQRVIARSSAEVEYRALLSVATDLVWIQNLLAEIGIAPSQTPMLWSDNLGAQALACNPVYHAQTKHIELDVYFIRNLVSEHKLEVRYVPTESQSPDLLTKALSFELFKMLSNKLYMTDPMPSLRGPVEKRATQSEIHETRATVDMEFAAPETHLINLPTANL